MHKEAFLEIQISYQKRISQRYLEMNLHSFSRTYKKRHTLFTINFGAINFGDNIFGGIIEMVAEIVSHQKEIIHCLRDVFRFSIL